MIAKCVFGFTATLLLWHANASAQLVGGTATEVVVDSNATPITVAPPTVFMFVEQMPEFTGGNEAMNAYLQQHLVYPDSAKEHGVQGKVIVKFIVDENGNVVHPEVVRGLSSDLDAEALRIVRSMPTWKAGKNNGQNVAVYYTLPIVFRQD